MPEQDSRPLGLAASRLDGARGWNADQFGRQLRLPQVRRPFGGVWNGVGVVGRFVGTLLGPEGTGHPDAGDGGGVRASSVRAFLFLVPPASCGGVRVGRGRVGGFWWVVENCTVDASIF